MKKTKNSLLSWYKKTNFQMPWRDFHNPYQIWISEIMLQQTQVQTVKKYYTNWMNKHPTVESVATDNIDSILKLWEGLGYYKRAHNIHKAAHTIVKKHRSKIPNTYDDLIQLEGIGDYTASAILSIAYKKKYPAIDGNLKRVISRLYALSVSSQTTQVFKEKVQRLMNNDNAGEINQAFMDLGREICTYKAPKCNLCPISKQCIAYLNNEVDKFPKANQSNPKPLYDVVVGMIYKNNKFLISKRKNKGLLKGLWELPGGKKDVKENNRECLKREIKEELDIEIDIKKKIGVINHQYSHFKINLIGYLCIYKSGQPKPLASDDIKWIYKKNINSFAFPKSTLKFFHLTEGDMS